jgi:hypothetical protein
MRSTRGLDKDQLKYVANLRGARNYKVADEFIEEQARQREQQRRAAAAQQARDQQEQQAAQQAEQQRQQQEQDFDEREYEDQIQETEFES